ncbi:hypothetical protein LX32DRAFT_649623 [Colletotrichum zoysiae]|uniref:Uncharacterized protein n=1 Tax=Colletotrichum zoysiae TaxID=1216348 RepID=A0AAD9HPG8_9PEZI|nr:hypothetical protein LX32DRAFT_649623 [Colletotrichum zoysiae]
MFDQLATQPIQNCRADSPVERPGDVVHAPRYAHTRILEHTRVFDRGAACCPEDTRVVRILAPVSFLQVVTEQPGDFGPESSIVERSTGRCQWGSGRRQKQATGPRRRVQGHVKLAVDACMSARSPIRGDIWVLAMIAISCLTLSQCRMRFPTLQASNY